MVTNVSMKTTKDHSPITIIGYNNNKKFLIIHPPTKEGGRMPKVEKQSFLPLHKCFKKKLRISGCLRCGSQPDNYTTVLKLGVEVAKWRCGNCGMATRIKLQQTPPLVSPPHEVKNDIHETKSKGKRCTSIESDNVFEVEKIIADRDVKEGGKEFFVKWMGYPWSDASWEPLINLAGAPELLAEYLHKKRAKPDK